MTLTDKMEELSIGFMKIVANSTGYFNMTGRDYGTDMHIRFARGRSTKSGCRFMTSGRGLDLQLKAVHKKYTKESENEVSYALEVKNYNDLVDRANELGMINPLVLIVFIFPDDENEWINLQAENLVMKGCAYYYMIPQGAQESENSSNVTIKIPRTNIVDKNIFDRLFDQFK